MIAEVQLWGRTIGAVSLDEGREVAAFQYDADFARSGIELSPLVMPLSERVHEFPALPRTTFHGLPGLLADFEACRKAALMKRGRAASIIEEVHTAVKRWPEFAAEAKLSDEWQNKIQKPHRLTFPKA